MIPETILVGAALAVAVWKVYHRSKGRLAALADAAERLGIERPSSHHFSGKVDGWRVMILPDPQRDVIELRVLSDGRWPADVGLGRESTMPSLLKMVTDGDVEIGDAAFDADVLVAGDRTWLAGALDSATRPLVSRAVRSGVVVDGGEIRMQNKSSELQAHEVVGLMRLMVRLADALSAASADLPGRLAANVQHDPEVAVRRACLSHLEAVYPDAPETARARLAALLDPDSALRLEAARNAGRDGFAALRALLDEPLEAGQLVEVIEILSHNFPPDAIAPLLMSQVGGPGSAHAIRALTRHGRSAALPVLLARAPAARGDEAAAVAEALGVFGDANVEDALLALLDNDASHVKRAAAIALGRVGTGRALARLDAQTQGLLVDADLKKAARTAAEAIRARGGEGLRGGLALVDAAGAEGGLTLSNAEEPER